MAMYEPSNGNSVRCMLHSPVKRPRPSRLDVTLRTLQFNMHHDMHQSLYTETQDMVGRCYIRADVRNNNACVHIVHIQQNGKETYESSSRRGRARIVGISTRSHVDIRCRGDFI